MPVMGIPGRQKAFILTSILFILVLFNILPTLKSRLENDAQNAHEEDRPRYLHQSTFRINPNLEDERQLSTTLQNLESQALSLQGESSPPDIIWQILLGHEPTQEQRGDDSIQFEKMNSAWEYRVSSIFALPHSQLYASRIADTVQRSW